jgi:peroxiredoxin
MLPLGTIAPSFTLNDSVTDTAQSLLTLQSKVATVIMFICNHCPYVQLILPKLLTVARHYQTQGIAFVAISSNDSSKFPEDGPDKMRELATLHSFSFPYLYDATQEVAKAYHAACTPDFYIFDQALKCVYRGRFDDATPGNGKPVTGYDLCQALDSILKNTAVSTEQHPSVGCNIKWR